MRFVGSRLVAGRVQHARKPCLSRGAERRTINERAQFALCVGQPALRGIVIGEGKWIAGGTDGNRLPVWFGHCRAIRGHVQQRDRTVGERMRRIDVDGGVECRVGFFGAARAPFVAAERDPRLDQLRRQAYGFAHAGLAALPIVQAGQRAAEQKMRAGILTIEAQRGFGPGAGIHVAAAEQKERARPDLRGHIGRCEVCDLQQLSHDGRGVAGARGHIRQLRMGLDGLRRLLDGPPILDRGLRVFALFRVAITPLDGALAGGHRIARAGAQDEKR